MPLCPTFLYVFKAASHEHAILKLSIRFPFKANTTLGASRVETLLLDCQILKVVAGIFVSLLALPLLIAHVVSLLNWSFLVEGGLDTSIASVGNIECLTDALAQVALAFETTATASWG